MPWKETEIVEERMEFVVRLDRGESMAALCREFGVSRKTGYKIARRYRELGALGLQDESRAPKRRPNRTPEPTRQRIIELREQHGLGARKIRRLLSNEKVRAPAASTIHAILEQEGLIKPRRRRRCVPRSVGNFAEAQQPNDRWTLDYKGQFRLGNKRYCYPLTLQDDLTRYSIACASLENTRTEGAKHALAEAFLEFGLPLIIRSDNGAPFASRSLLGLSRLSAWLIKLGIQVEHTDPASPQQNGRHERFHKTLKADTTRPAAQNHLAQQERFDRFRDFYNHKRPHEALDDDTPADHYHPACPWSGRTPEPEYPLHDDVLTVSRCGHLTLGRGRHIFLSTALAGELVGLRETEDQVMLVSFASLELGKWDLASNNFDPRAPIRATLPKEAN